VRHYSSSDQPLPLPKEPAIAARWFPQPQILSNKPGMHRFVWDLRVGDPREVTVDDPEGTGIETWIGPLVVPASYTAKLTANGRTLTQRFEVAMDPRCTTTHSDLVLQYVWAVRAFKDLVATRRSHDKALDALRANFTAALEAIESADRAPTAQAIQLYQESDKALRRNLRHSQ
jgi:hypothetical protein